jgi:hypothetical protein
MKGKLDCNTDRTIGVDRGQVGILVSQRRRLVVVLQSKQKPRRVGRGVASKREAKEVRSRGGEDWSFDRILAVTCKNNLSIVTWAAE